jgi:hypothetical protein
LISWFQILLSNVNLYRYTTAAMGMGMMHQQQQQLLRINQMQQGGGFTSRIQLAHSLKAPGVNP